MHPVGWIGPDVECRGHLTRALGRGDLPAATAAKGLRCSNCAAFCAANAATPPRNKTGKRTRHINLRFHRVREAVAKNSIDVKRVTGGNDPATSEMVADILTKSTPAPLFVVMASIMSGMHRK